MKWIMLLSPRHRWSWNCLSQPPTTGKWRSRWSSCRDCVPNRATFVPQLHKLIFRAVHSLHAWTTHLMFLHFETFDSFGKLFCLLASVGCPCLPSLTRVVKMGAWLTVIDGLNADHSLPLQAHGKYLLFVTQEQ